MEEVDGGGDGVPQVGDTGLGATSLGTTGLGATGFQGHGSGQEPPVILGATGVEAGRIDAHEEGKFIKRLVDPRLPTEEEVENHMLTHLPYRNWCPECGKAKGKDLDHRCAVDRERKWSEYCVIIVL